MFSKFPLPSVKKDKKKDADPSSGDKDVAQQDDDEPKEVEFKKGDYQIQVRIFEGRELAGR